MTDTPQKHVAIAQWHVQAARASWMAPLIAVIANVTVGMTAEERSVRVVVGAIAGIIIVVGLLFALWAIVAAFTKGPRRILLPAGVGLLLNGLLIYLFVHTMIVVREVAARQRAQIAIESSDEWIPSGEGWHVDREAMIAIRFPDGWEVVPNPQAGITVMALSPLESVNDIFRENITIATGRLPPNADPDTYLATDREDLRQSTIGFEEVAIGFSTIHGVKWSWITYRQIVQDTESLVTGYLAVAKGRVYAVFCAGQPETFENFKGQFEKAIQTVHIPH